MQAEGRTRQLDKTNPIFVPTESLSQRKNEGGVWICAAVLIVFAAILYMELVSYRTFGPEFAQFYKLNVDARLSRVWVAYSTLTKSWYRPTAFVLPYYIGQFFIDWHNVVGWKVLNLATALITSLLIFWLVLVLFPGRRLAALFAAIFFIASPNLFIVVFEISAFDFMYIIFVLLCVIWFIQSAEAAGRRASWLLALSVLSYGLALTSKEISIVTPVYLGLVSLLLLWRSWSWKQWPRFALRLLPFLLLMGLYWVGHVQNIPKSAYGDSGDYRIQPNANQIIENAIKYPVWMARVYSGVKDSMNQAACYAKWWTTVPGVLAAVLIVITWIRKAREDERYRWAALFLLGWMAVFLIVPIYSGGYLWHGNLAMVAYAVFFGVALDDLFARIPVERWRTVAVTGFLVAFLLFARASVRDFLEENPRRFIYHLNYWILREPPVPAQQLSGPALVFYEDRLGLSSWGYGGGNNLFKYVYSNLRIEEKETPVMHQVDPGLCQIWLSRPNAYYFRYDNDLRWHNASDQFKAECNQRLNTTQ